MPAPVEAQIEKELRVIATLKVAPYFLSVQTLVRMARRRDILCQGRGSAANSAVCYCLGVTAVDPSRSSLLFERFLSVERAEPPDIDVDFEHERREELIQDLYALYGRDRAAMVSEVVTYRGRSALREVAKVFGLSAEEQGRLARMRDHWGGGGEITEVEGDAVRFARVRGASGSSASSSSRSPWKTRRATSPFTWAASCSRRPPSCRLHPSSRPP